MQKEHNVPPNLIKNRFIVILSRTSLDCLYIPFSDTFQKYKKIRKTHYNCRFLPYRKKHKRSEWFSVRWLFKRPMVAGLLTAYSGWGAIITLTEIMVVCGFRSTSPFPPCFLVGQFMWNSLLWVVWHLEMREIMKSIVKRKPNSPIMHTRKRRLQGGV